MVSLVRSSLVDLDQGMLIEEMATTRVMLRRVAILLLASVLPSIGWAQDTGAVFVMTNGSDLNQVVAFDRDELGLLIERSRVATGGRGTGGEIDPLQSQGSLVLSQDSRWLFAVNAGSDEISQFAVEGTGIGLVDIVRSRGARPISLTQSGDLLYVLNAGGRPSIQGFRLQQDGGMERISDSKRFLASDVAPSGRSEGPAQIAFTPDGSQIVLTDRLTDEIHLFSVGDDGRTSDDSVRWPSVGEGPFGFGFDPQGNLLVSEVWGRNPAGTVLEGAVSSYAILQDGSLENLSASVENFEAATCWLVADGRKSAFTTNTTSGTLSRYRVRRNGRLKVRQRGVGYRFSGSPAAFPTDLAITSDGSFLYSLNAGRGTVGIFRVKKSGKLIFLGEAGSLPAVAGLQGIAAR